MDLLEKSRNTLELPAVLEMLAGEAVSEPAKAEALALVPSVHRAEVERLLAETSDAKDMMVYKGSPSLSGLRDVRGSLARADMGGVLNTRELLEIAGVLQSARAVRSYGMSAEKETCIDHLFKMLQTNRFLEDKIVNSIPGEDEIADSASSELSDIRRKMRAAAARVRDSLQKIISAPSMAKFLQDPIITTRSDRYVVPVKAECKGSVPGLVHDVSASGATLFVEPMAAVKANNEIRELKAKEKAEIERILAELSAECAAHREDIDADFSALVRLDGIFARAKLSFKLNAGAPELSERGVRLRRARHPLLDKDKAVPIDVELGEDYDTLVITGPNTGGKTVTLKTIGLLTLMAECGLHIPADHGSAISVFRQVLADIGDEQSIEQSLSTFSAHMKNIVDIVASCDRDTLVLFDELGAGTDPAEGAALANALIEFCRQCGSRVAATTHYAELKLYAMRTEGVMNASCEFDVETLRPTYRLLIGIPGKSNAFAISRRLGLPEPIIDKAKSLVNENDRNFEDVLNQLEQQRQQMEAAKLEAERLRQETEQMKEKSEAYYAEIKREREKAVRAARAEAQSIIDDARRTSNEVADELKQLRKQLRENADVQGSNAKQTELRRRLNEAEDRLAGHDDTPKPRPQAARAIRVGDTVELVRFGTRASVLAINKDGSYLLQAGIMKVTAQPDEVYLIEETKQQAKKIIERSQRAFRSAGASTELDLRGMSADEAIATLDIFLDNAMMANLASVRIIHGKGTGVLRKAVQDELKRNRCVKRYRLGVYGEGEDGVTIAELA